MLPLTSASTSGGMEGELYTWAREGGGWAGIRREGQA